MYIRSKYGLRAFILNCLLIIQLSLTIGCSGNESTSPEPIDNSGWAQFSRGEYEKALSTFEKELKSDPEDLDALTGIGWCQLSLDSLLIAREALDEVLSEDAEIPDAACGYAFTLSALREYQNCVCWVDSLLLMEPGYIFHYRRSINYNSLNLMAARCMFLLNEYMRSYQYLEKVEGSKELDTGSQSFPEELIAEIVRLEKIH